MKMRLSKLAFIVAALALFAAACGGGDSTGTNQAVSNGGTQPTASPAATTKPTPADELAEAKATFSQVCSNCHGDKGEGGPVKIEGKRLKVPSLTEGHGLSHTDAELAKQIANGGEGMPAFKDRLNQDQINALVRFIRRDIQAGKVPAAGGANTSK
jgi:mono/diheme cytochrome c family protein